MGLGYLSQGLQCTAELTPNAWIGRPRLAEGWSWISKDNCKAEGEMGVLDGQLEESVQSLGPGVDAELA